MAVYLAPRMVSQGNLSEVSSFISANSVLDSLAGPILGGVSLYLFFETSAITSESTKALAQHVSWRWCFFINLYLLIFMAKFGSELLITDFRPIGGIAAILLFVFLNVNPVPKRPLRDQIAELDFVGLFGLVAGIACLLIGLNFSERGC